MKVLLTAFLFGFAVCAFARDLPSYVPLCKRMDPNISNCIKKTMLAIQPYLAKGIKELNIPAFEPLTIPMVKLEQGTGAVNYKASLTDIKLSGLSKFKVHQLMAEFVTAKAILAKLEFPEIRLVADYKIGGNVLVLPIQGNGEVTANITNCKAEVMVLSESVQKKGKEYIQVKEVKSMLQFGDVKANFDNLFNGDSVLGMTTNNFLNENAKDILNEVKPAIEAVTSMLTEDVTNKIFRSVPFNQLFPH